MSETDAKPETVELPAPVVVPEEKRRRSVWPVFFVVGFLILAGGEGYLWKLHLAQGAQATQLAVLQAEVADLRLLAAKTAPPAESVTTQADLAMKFASLAAQVNAVQAQVATDHGTLSALQENSADLTGSSRHGISRLNALETARMALEAGQPVGNVPDAPPALAQFLPTWRRLPRHSCG